MATKPSPFFKRPPKKGDPINSPGTVEGLEAMAKALANLEVKGVDPIVATLDWANGYPRITISMKEAAP